MTLPFWTTYILRVFTWKVILGYNGAINAGLLELGLIDKPLEYLLIQPLSRSNNADSRLGRVCHLADLRIAGKN